MGRVFLPIWVSKFSTTIRLTIARATWHAPKVLSIHLTLNLLEYKQFKAQGAQILTLDESQIQSEAAEDNDEAE